jgi:hypothetical protein
MAGWVNKRQAKSRLIPALYLRFFTEERRGEL